MLNHYQDTTTEMRRMEAQHTSSESQVSLEVQAQRYELNQARDQIASLKSENLKVFFIFYDFFSISTFKLFCS